VGRAPRPEIREKVQSLIAEQLDCNTYGPTYSI